MSIPETSPSGVAHAANTTDRPPAGQIPTEPSLLQLIIYSAPALPLAALTLPLYVLVPTFYTETLGLPLAMVGFALLLIRLFDAINDPVIGWVADHARSPLGRRRTVFLVSLPLTSLAGFMLFWPPQDATVSYLIGWGMALSLGYTATLIPYYAWGAEMVASYHGRSKLAGFREGFTLVGTLIAIALPFTLGFSQAGELHGLALLAIVVATALPVLGLLTVWKVPEPREYTRKPIGFIAGLGYLARNKPFVRLIAAYFMNGLANGIPATLFLYFVSDRLQLPDARGPLLFVYFLSAVAGVPVAMLVARRISKHRAWTLAMIVNCLIFAAAPLLEPGALLAFAAICVSTGILLGFDLALPSSMQADVIDVDTMTTGEQRSGLYFAAWSLTTKLSLAVGVGTVFPLLALFGFDPQASGGSSPTSLFALAVIYAWIPIVLKLVAIAIMWNFPLGEAEHDALRKKIEADE